MKVSFIVLLGLTAAVVLPRRSAAVRHWVLAMAIACAAATPALEVMVPAWKMPSFATVLGSRVRPLILSVPLSVSPNADPQIDLAPRKPIRAVTSASVFPTLRTLRLAGTAVCFFTLATGFVRLGRLASRSRKIRHGRSVDFAHALSRMYGLRRRVELLQGDQTTLLGTWGWLFPKVILPRAVDDWPDGRVRVVLAHELAHIRRGDWVVLVLAEILRCAYWFNPLLWIACRQLREYSEHACDDAVLTLGIDGPEYATHLLDLARTFRRQRLVPAAMMSSARFERRIAAMLNVDVNRRPVTRSACLITAIALLTLTAAVAGLGAAAQTTSASFSGSLVDTVGRILPNETIVLANAATGERRGAISDQAGHFQFLSMLPADYLVEVQKAGFANSQGRVTLAAGQNLQRDVALQLGSIHETVTVRSTDVPKASPPPASQLTGSTGDAPDPCAQSPVGGCITPPMKLRDVRPGYPKAAQDAGIGGTVKLQGRIGTDGFVRDLQVVAPADAALSSAMVDAVQQWQFTQTRLDGVPMEVQIQVTANFVIQP